MIIERTNLFKKDFKIILKRGYDIKKLKKIITILVNGEELPIKHKNHKMRNYNNIMNCHIEPDWVLLYKIEKDILLLYRTGTHSDLEI